jgi:hypothetical protein
MILGSWGHKTVHVSNSVYLGILWDSPMRALGMKKSRKSLVRECLMMCRCELCDLERYIYMLLIAYNVCCMLVEQSCVD